MCPNHVSVRETMDFLIVVLTLLFALALFHGLGILSRSSKKLPPGPIPLPLIGNLHLLGAQPHKSLAKLAKTYGPIMCLKLGRITSVVISSPAVAKQVLQKQDLAFSNRCILDSVRARDHDKYSVVWLPVASQWRSLRKILNTNIFSGNSLDSNQHLRFKKVEELIAYCRKNSQIGEAVDIGAAALKTSLNLLSNTILSVDLADPYSDSGKEFKDWVSEIEVVTGKLNLVDFFPVLKMFVDPQGVRRDMTIYMDKVLNLIDGLINERLEQKKSQGVVKKDFLDVLLTTSQENPQEISRPHIQHMCLNLFIAGTDTTSGTVEWAMTEMLRNSETMKRAKDELAQVIGRGKPIPETDVANLPYLQCIVKETLRLHTLLPFLIQRTVEEDVELCGYIIPKGSQVLVNAWAIGRDPSVWENPLTFKPERFWKSKIDVRGLDFELLPFGGGRRICPGMPLAMKMIPFILGSLLNSFDWKLEGDITPDHLDMEETFGFTMQKTQPLRAIPISL